MTASRIVEALDEGEHCASRLGLRLEPAAIEQFAFEGREEALAHGVVIGIPTEPIEGRTPASRQRWPNSIEVYWADSTDRRNTMLAYRATPETDPALPHCDTRGVQFRSPVSPETRDLASLFSTMLVAQPGQA